MRKYVAEGLHLLRKYIRTCGCAPITLRRCLCMCVDVSASESHLPISFMLAT